MRVAVVTRYFPTSVQGHIGHSAYQTLRILAKTIPLHVFVPHESYPAALTPRAHRIQRDLTWSPPDVAATYIPYPALPVLSRPVNGLVQARTVLPHVRRFAPDVILNYVVYPDGYSALRIARALHVPLVTTAIGSDLNRISDPLSARGVRATLRGATLVTTVSRDLARTAIRLGADPARTLPILNGCDTAIFHPMDRSAARLALNLPLQEQSAIYIGRLDLAKGLLELIEAAASLHATRPAFALHIVGDGPAEPTLRAAITRLQAAPFIHLHPPCPTAQVAQWMAAADLVTLPSYREGCPNVVVEALAAGRPVVATNVGGIPELMDSTCGALVPPRDIPALTHALDQTLATPWNPEAIATRHARSWSDVARDLLATLHQSLTT